MPPLSRKRIASLLYELHDNGCKYSMTNRTILCPYDINIKEIPSAMTLITKYHFEVQYVIV